MAEIYRLPAVSPTMELGTLVAWRLEEGDAFSSGAVIAEIGTDKATVEAELYEDGVLLARLVAEDDEVPVNAPIAVLGAAGEDAGELIATARAELDAMRKKAAGDGAPAAAEAATDDGGAEPEPSPAAAASAPGADEAKTSEAPTTSSASRPSDPPPPQASVTRTWHDQALPPLFLDPPGDVRAASGRPGRVLASPLARAIARDKGIDLRGIDGTGPGGRIVRADVERQGRPGGAAVTVPDDTVVKLTPMRKTIARRLLASHTDIPTFFLTVTFDMDGMVAFRDGLKVHQPDLKVSYNDLMVKAVAKALRAYPAANASWTDKGIVRHGRVDVGVAVAVDEGLLTPVIRNADQLDLATIGSTTRALAAKARDGKLMPEDYQGGTFTISNLGMMDIEHFTAILNPPEAGILAVGALAQVPVVSHGQLGIGWRMKATMTCDHRVIDGAVGAGFLAVLRRYVEVPALLFV
ncbi:MAG: 2-oxo acid dehydrogenase subunit E2 [Alphaproteobacteria bacterium]|nr:2-oxo acid dehydrogenase subunit E2 [Alphaproteobacteria bacterium]